MRLFNNPIRDIPESISENIPKRTLIRLTYEQVEHLEKQLSPPMVTHQTTELQAGYMLGIQMALKLLKEGFVSES